MSAFGLNCLTEVSKTHQTRQIIKYLSHISNEETEPWKAYSEEPRVTMLAKGVVPKIKYTQFGFRYHSFQRHRDKKFKVILELAGLRPDT